MLNIKNKIKFIIEFCWDLPQNLIGLLMYNFYKLLGYETDNLNGAKLIYWGINKADYSMGNFLFIPDNIKDVTKQLNITKNYIVHEYDHKIQSNIFGPLWFLIFDIKSIIWCYLWDYITLINKNKYKYCDFYPEKKCQLFW